MRGADGDRVRPCLDGILASAERVMETLAMTIEARDAYTLGHGDRLARYATAVAARLHLDRSTMAVLYWGALLHDIGKVGIPDSVLLKPGPLTAAEYELMKQHTIIGDDICRPFPALHEVRRVVRSHHERLDGTGYPDRLRGSAIPLAAQIVGIVDLFDAVTTCRPHVQARSAAQAIAFLREEASRGWRDGALVETFVATLSVSGALASAA